MFLGVRVVIDRTCSDEIDRQSPVLRGVLHGVSRHGAMTVYFPSRLALRRTAELNDTDDARYEWCENPQGISITVPHKQASECANWVSRNLTGYWMWQQSGDDWTVTFQNPASAASFRVEFGV